MRADGRWTKGCSEQCFMRSLSPDVGPMEFLMKRVLIILAWTGGAYFGSGIVLAILWGILGGIAVGISILLHYNIHNWFVAHHSWSVIAGIIFRMLCALAAFTALILALRGGLPGTKIRRDSSA